jgi:hypothetical protein
MAIDEGQQEAVDKSQDALMARRRHRQPLQPAFYKFDPRIIRQRKVILLRPLALHGEQARDLPDRLSERRA